ncbi:MAG: extracellular solute-binding protein [Lentisphaeria bacterium]|nr:extracellular solute-binding protein [Lentisphaeria bacterium]
MKSRYQNIYDDIMGKIRSGVYYPGFRLPTEPELARYYGVSVGTLRKAIDRMVLEKRINRIQGSGTFICGQKPLGDHQHGHVAARNIKTSEFVYGACQYLGDQAQINQVLFRDEPEIRYLILPSPLDIKPILSSLYNQCSLIQAPMAAFNEMSDYFRPLPEELFADIPEPLIKQCRSLDGNLRTLPILFNQTLCYVNRRNADRLGVELPCSNWTLDDLKNLCHTFREKDPAVTPLGVLSTASLWFEILLWNFGGDFFDERGNPWLPEKAFRSVVNYYRELSEEHLCANITSFQGISIQDFIQKPYAQMIFYGPRGCMDSEPDVMEVLPLPGNQGSGVIFSLGIPCNAPRPEQALAFLKKLKDHRLAEVHSAAPAAREDAALWCKKQRVRHAEYFMHFPEKQHFISGNPRFYHWQNPVYSLINLAFHGNISVEDARKDILSILWDSVHQDSNGMFLM